MSASDLSKLIAGRDTTAVLALDQKALDDVGSLGPTAYYYLGLWMASRDEGQPPLPNAGARTRLLYRLGFDRAKGLARREAGLALVHELFSAGLWGELVSFSKEYDASVGPEWGSERPRLDALDALCRNAEEKALVADLGRAYPVESAEDAEALSYFNAAADMRSGGKHWAKAFRRLLLEMPESDWSARAYALLTTEPRMRGLFSVGEFHALAMRDAVNRKDYGLAYTEALLGGSAAMGRHASKAMIADAGKAFLYAGKLKDGEGQFTAIGWTARFYKARFAMALDRLEEAAELFKKASADAPTRADADAARWYALDCGYRAALEAAASLSPPIAAEPATAAPESIAETAAEAAAREAALDDLVDASASWSDPTVFSDLVNGLFRDALRARDWRLVEEMAARLAGKLPPDTGARLAYVASRAFELKLDSSPDAASRASAAALRFAAIAEDASAPLYYRIIAAWRAGIEPGFVPGTAPPAIAPPGIPSITSDAETLISGMASFGLVDMALSEAKSRLADLDEEALIRLASLFSRLGRADCALRLTLAQTSRPSYEALRSDYEMLYPRPYLDEIRSLRLPDRVTESLAFGLLRSESLFRTDAVSGAGAIGLSQLMPSTAAEQAKALGLSTYDLSFPKDNLAIGLAYFSSLLVRVDGRPLRAMMAYNAGWGRLKAWAAESGDLPDDIMIEALGLAETRQYCRNILQSTVIYGLLYYGKTIGETVGELVEGEDASTPVQ
jgi:soluble lytic murein transglycosylase